jgi:SAM domain (Sterile alpha motif)
MAIFAAGGAITGHAADRTKGIRFGCLAQFGPVAAVGPRSPREGAAMWQIADWLERRGMSEYAERFAENDIDSALCSSRDGFHNVDC